MTGNMSAELTAEQGWTMQEITDAATAALQAYFTGERLGEAVYTAKLANILYGVEGVKNCHLLTPSADVSMSATALPVLGTVTITEIEAGEAWRIMTISAAFWSRCAFTAPSAAR